MLKSLEGYIPLFENYLNAEDQAAFIKTLHDPSEKAILDILTSDAQNLHSLTAKMRQLGVSSQLQNSLLNQKLLKYIQNSTELTNNQTGQLIRKRFSLGSFQYSSPPTLNNQIVQEHQQQNACELNLQLNLESYIAQKIKVSPQFIRNLNDFSISKVTDDQLLGLPLAEKQFLLEKCGVIFHFPSKFIINFLLSFQEQKRKNNSSYTLPARVLTCLTKDQINDLKDAFPQILSNQDFIEIWFNQQFAELISKQLEGESNYTFEKCKAARNTYIKITQLLQPYRDYPTIKSYINKLKSQILILSIKVSQTSVDQFIDYLETYPKITNLRNICKQAMTRRNQQKNVKEPRFRFELLFDKTDPDSIVEDYLVNLFQNHPNNNQSINQLRRFLEQKYLRKLNARIRLSKGQSVENANDYFSIAQIKQLKDKSQIRLLPTNKQNYQVEDDVSLSIAVKNVKSIKIKVYEINLEKQLLTNSSTIDDQINLSFLLPTLQTVYNNPVTNPFQVNQTVISLKEEIPKQMGVFIVDLQGQSVTSRAVIRKGQIICLDRLIEAGQQFSFYDQSGRALTESQGLKVWIRNKPVNLIGNKATIAYSQKEQHGNIIASIGSYAQTFQKIFVIQQYQFQVGFVYNSESFVVGQKSKVLLHGRLSLNKQPMSLQLLKNTKVKVSVTSNQDIKTFYSFDIENWNNDSQQTIEFPIQSYTKNINIFVETQIGLQNGKDVTLTKEKDIRIDLRESSTNFYDFYLEKSGKQYILNLLGANGQTISNADIVLSYTVTGIDLIERKQIKTNANGQVNLGQLTIVKIISAEINGSGANLQRVWSIDKFQHDFKYANSISYKKGQELALPINPSWSKKDVLLLKAFDKYYISDETNRVIIQNGKLRLAADVQEGFYILKLLPIDKTIEVTILKNINWESDNDQSEKLFNEDTNTIIEINKNVYQNISLKGVQFQKEEASVKANISIDLDGVPQQKRKNVRVHVLANNYYVPLISDGFNIQKFNTESSIKESDILIKNSSYYSNKTLSDQGAYVENRQKQSKLIGNNLEKPSIFLKRILVRETNQKDEELNDSDNYVDECATIKMNKNYLQKLRARKAEGLPKNIVNNNLLNLTSHNNFLSQTGDLNTNLTGDQITVNIPEGYNSIEVYILTPESAFKSVYHTSSDSGRKIKDLRHTGLQEKSQNKAWTMSRQVYQLQKGETKHVNRNCQWRTVGLSEIFDLANSKRIKLYSWSNHLLNWNAYSQEKKKQIYDKQYCHQLNTYIKMKDPQFFDRVVKDFIKNKISKTIVDLCLLHDPRAQQYAQLNKLRQLNAFEKVLLVYALVHQNKTDIAQNIVQSLELEQKSIKKNYQQFKANFDTIISAKESVEKQSKKQKKKKEKQSEQRPMLMKAMAAPVCRMSGGGGMKKRSVPSQQSMIMLKRSQIKNEKKAFVPIESTKQYTETTYYNVKNYKSQAPKLVQSSLFWAQLSRHILQKKTTQFLSKSFMFLNNPIDFILSASFISNESSANFNLSNQGENYIIETQSPLLLYIKDVEQLEYSKKFAVLINQRFFDPLNRVAYEQDGTQIEKEVEQFIIKRPYICQTVINNTSGTPLELQVLLDIPKGAIPLKSNQYTQITNININPYSSQSFQRYFYFPSQGSYAIYPSNAARKSIIIAKANKLSDIIVKKQWTINKLQSFDDILRSGNKEAVINFMQTKNIFDANIFNVKDILWMLKDKSFYQSVISILRKRNYYQSQVWNFGFLHGDIDAIRQIMNLQQDDNLQAIVFQYFPYYSSRTHQFANESKSTIRNVQLKETYLRFLVGSIINIKQHSYYSLSICYYLILQDRLKQANEIIQKLSKQQYNAHEVQFDYMRCFLDLSLNSPNFTNAREIIKKYTNFPIQSWKKLFSEVSKTIQAEDEQVPDSSEIVLEQYQTQIIEEIGQFKIIQPAHTEIVVSIFELNLEQYFSEYPFNDVKTFTSIKPSKTRVLEKSQQTREVIVKRSDYDDLKDATVEVSEHRQGLPPKVINTFTWNNPDVKVKFNENSGTLQVYINKKRSAGSYVKVFADKNRVKQFYRDGYTDMTGTFRYAMSDIEGISQFSILISTDRGGVIQKVKPPSKLSSF